MKILVTGCSGFVGRRLTAALARRGHAGIGVSRQPIAEMPEGWISLSRESVLSGLPPDFRPDAVVHLEVKHHVFDSGMEHRRLFDEVNIGGTEAWLEWAARHDIPRFVYFSSIKAVIPRANGATDEQAAGCRNSPYGASKWTAEQSVRRWAAESPSRAALILRPAVIYGAGASGNISAMVTAIRRRRFYLLGSNGNIKSLVSVGNVAASTIHLLERMRPGSLEIYNLTDAESFSVRELDFRLRARLGKSGNSPTLPLGVARVVAVLGDALRRCPGLAVPIDSRRYLALIETSHFSCAKLLATDFVHPEPALTDIAELPSTNISAPDAT